MPRGPLPATVQTTLIATVVSLSLHLLRIALLGITLLGTALLGIALLGIASPCHARTLHWQRLDVTAHLQADGRLEVAERHTMVFSGDWNGGERSFRIRQPQTLHFDRIDRIDTQSGEAQTLSQGSLGLVDRYDWVEGNTLRWRSRRPDSPPFDDTTFIYEIRYALSNILLRDGDRYVLDHDFSFADRPGMIEIFKLDLMFDPAWRNLRELPRQFIERDVEPGRGFVIRTELRFTAEGTPPWAYADQHRLRLAVVLVGLALILFWLLRYYRSELRLGRYAPLVPAAEIDRAWLQTHIFKHRPEEVGAAWDQQIGSAEVMATFARLIAEGKLASEVISKKVLWVKVKEIKLKRIALLDDFKGYERRLVDGFFFNDRSEVTTSDIRKHYKSKVFRPVKLIKEELEERLNAIPELARRGEPERRFGMVVILTVVGLVRLLSALWIEPAIAAGPLVFLGFLLVALSVPALLVPLAVRESLTHARLKLLPLFLFAALPLIGGAGALVVVGFQFHRPVIVGCALLALGVARLAIELSRTRSGPELMRHRKLLAAARRLFQLELRRREPRLEDAWFPYIIALGLAPQASQWGRSHGSRLTTGLTSSSLHADGGGNQAPGSWTGGGGAFGGAGASASWASAMGTFSGGGSSSGGGSGSSGGSSGGGGGGGW